METIVGIKLGGSGFEHTDRSIAACSLISRGMFKFMIENCPVTFNQILYPYADMLSLSGKRGTESTQIFGTHMILRNIGSDVVSTALKYGMDFAGDITGDDVLPLEIVEFTLNDGCAAAEDIAKFLECGCSAQTVGDFAKMLSGFVPHWRIREAAKVFASFSEMSYRVSRGSVCGLSGGRLTLRGGTDTECVKEIKRICFQKTGCR